MLFARKKKLGCQKMLRQDKLLKYMGKNFFLAPKIPKVCSKDFYNLDNSHSAATKNKRRIIRFNLKMQILSKETNFCRYNWNKNKYQAIKANRLQASKKLRK